MREILLPALRASLVAWVLCGLLYPTVVTGIGQTLLPFQANGSLEVRPDGEVIGSRLIGQQWDGPQWFHGRLSAISVADPHDPTRTVPASYDATNSGGSIWRRPAGPWRNGWRLAARSWSWRNPNWLAGRCPPTC
jgi:potassium-transporting ATPase KdpC subunit